MSDFAIEMVDGPGAVAGQCSLALDSNGNPRIAYVSGGDRPMYAARDAGQWTLQEIAGAPPSWRGDGNRVCLDLDSAGNPHIAYKEAGSGHLVYGVRHDNSWTTWKVPTSLWRFEPASVVGHDFRLHYRRDTPELQNTAHFVYHDSSTGQLGYTRRMQDGSFTQVVAARANTDVSRTGFAPSIAFTHESGSFHIAYVEEFTGDHASPTHSRIWINQIIDPFEGRLGDGKVIEDGTIKVNRPTSLTSVPRVYCMAYVNAERQTLNVVFHEPHQPDLMRQEVARTVWPVAPSLSQTSRGRFRIAYGDENKMKLASQDGQGQWNAEIVDPEGGEAAYLAYEKVAVKGHLAYTTQDALKYATWIEQP